MGEGLWQLLESQMDDLKRRSSRFWGNCGVVLHPRFMYSVPGDGLDASTTAQVGTERNTA